MPVAALITITDAFSDAVEDRPALQRIFGVPLFERLARQLAAAGVNHIVVLIDAPSRTVNLAIDRLRQDRIAVEQVRQVREAAGFIHPGERVILAEGGLVLDPADVEWLCEGQAARILVTGAACDPARFERIDADARWARALAIDGHNLRQTADGLGDWDLGSTVLRLAVQLGGSRHLVAATAEDGSKILPIGERELSELVPDVVEIAGQAGDGLFAKWIVDPLSARVTRRLAHAQIPDIAYVALSAGLLIIGMALALGRQPAIALSIFPVALLLFAIGSAIARIARARDYQRIAIMFPFALVAIVLGGIATMPGSIGANVNSVVALWLGAQALALRQLRSAIPAKIPLQIDPGAVAVVLAVGFALHGFAVAALICVAGLLAEHFWRLRQIARV